MNNVTPKPRRRALTGVDDSDGVGVGFDGPALPVVLSGGLFGFGRLRLVLVDVPPELTGLSLGRDVINAPRTSSPSWNAGAAMPIPTAQRQTSPTTMTLNR